MFEIHLNSKLEERLARLAKKTGRTMACCAREAIEAYIQDMEDYDLAADAIREPGRTYSAAEAKHALGLD